MSLLHSSDLRTSSSAALLTLRLWRCLTADKMCRMWQPFSASTSTENWREMSQQQHIGHNNNNSHGFMGKYQVKKECHTPAEGMCLHCHLLVQNWLARNIPLIKMSSLFYTVDKQVKMLEVLITPTELPQNTIFSLHFSLFESSLMMSLTAICRSLSCAVTWRQTTASNPRV